VSEFQPPPRVCPACAAENLPFATICRGCGVDMQQVPAGGSPGVPPGSAGSAVGRPRGGSLKLAAALVVLIVISLAALDLTGIVGLPHGPASSGPASSAPASVAQLASAKPSSREPAVSSPTPTPSAGLVQVGESVELAGVETHTVLRVEAWPGLSPPGPGQRYLAVEIQVTALPGQTARFDQLYYTVGNAAGVLRNAPQVGRQPALAYGSVGPGQSVVGWVSFLVPDPGPFVLNYHYPLGTNGETVSEVVALQPILPPTPEPVLPANPSPGSAVLPNFGYPGALPSSNYSGYGAQLPGTAISSVSGSWVQSSAHCGSNESSSASAWVGIDDGGLQDLQQLGTEVICRPGSTRPVYLAWYEMYPLPQVAIPIAVRPGDHFSASVTKRGTTWTLAIRDTTSGRHFTINQTRNSAAIQALWVVEAPSRLLADGDLQIVPLTSFARIAMSACSAVAGGVRRTIVDSRWAHYRFDMRTTSNTAKALTSKLTGSGTAFSSTWKHH
jgi:hypothetical protein